MKKLLLITNSSKSILNQRKEFVKFFKEKYELTICTDDISSLKNKKDLEGVSFETYFIDRSSTSIYKELKTIFSLYKIIRNHNSDETIIHSFALKPILYTSLINKVLFFNKLNHYITFTGLGFIFTSEKKNKFIRGLLSLVFRFCLKNKSENVIFQNRDDKLQLSKLKIVNEKSHVIYGSGVDVKFFNFVK